MTVVISDRSLTVIIMTAPNVPVVRPRFLGWPQYKTQILLFT